MYQTLNNAQINTSSRTDHLKYSDYDKKYVGQTSQNSKTKCQERINDIGKSKCESLLLLRP